MGITNRTPTLELLTSMAFACPISTIIMFILFYSLVICKSFVSFFLFLSLLFSSILHSKLPSNLLSPFAALFNLFLRLEDPLHFPLLHGAFLPFDHRTLHRLAPNYTVYTVVLSTRVTRLRAISSQGYSFHIFPDRLMSSPLTYLPHSSEAKKQD